MSSKTSRKAKSLRATRQGQSVKKARVPKRNLGLPMWKSPRAIMPQEFDTTLKYITLDQVSNVGGTAASIRFRTELFDVDPALGSTAMPGFTEFAQFYQRFRPLQMNYKFSCANYEVFPVTIIHGFSVSSIASGSLSIVYAGNPLFSTSILGPATGLSSRIFSRGATVPQIVGTAQPLYDDLYTGSTTSATLATAGTVYCNLGVISPAPLTANGVLVTVEITFKVRFYRPNLLLS